MRSLVGPSLCSAERRLFSTGSTLNTYMIQNIAAPADYLVSLAELKAHLAIEYSDDNTRLELLLETSRDLIESDSNLCIVEQQWRQTLSGFPDGSIKLDKIPIRSVVVKYYDANNVLQTLANSNYSRLINAQEGRLCTWDVWPDTYTRPDSCQVDMVCGFDAVPGVAKQACLMLCASWNENREAEAAQSTKLVEVGYERLIKSIRRGYLCLL